MKLNPYFERLFIRVADLLGFAVFRQHRTDVSSAKAKRNTESSSLTSTEPLLKRIHQVSPYEDFDFQKWPLDLTGWGSETPIFLQLIESLRPKLIIEVGSWKGGSAITMATIANRLNLPTEIVCVDTWLGALEFWTDHSDKERYQALELKNGYPTVYYQFLANVCHKEVQNRIIPFPQTSIIAARWFQIAGIKAELIYIDASHDEDDVFLDILQYWDSLCDGGIMLGDDYQWRGVYKAAHRAAAALGGTIKPDESGRCWMLQKSR